MNDSMKTLLAFIAGAAAGAAVGILMAPDKGSETRKKIMDRAKNMGDGMTDAVREKYEEFLDWKDSMMGDAEETVRKSVNTAINTAANTAKKTVNEKLDTNNAHA